MTEELTAEETAQDIIYWLKDDIKCLYMVSEIKLALKPYSEERFEFWEKVHKIVYKNFIED